MKLYIHQLEAIEKLKNGSILCGGVGSGKSLTALGYFLTVFGSAKRSGDDLIACPNPIIKLPSLYIITTARKRDTNEWEDECRKFGMSTCDDINKLGNKVVIDSWNNIKKYKGETGAYFIFDEQRVCGTGAWVQAFIEITKHNKWILLSATPGDTWMDYIPIFIANGFYKNASEFKREHVIWKYVPNARFYKVDRYINVERLIRLRNLILVDMNFKRNTVSHQEYIDVAYDIQRYKDMIKTRWNKDKNVPLANAAELCFELRKIVNSDPSRLAAVIRLREEHHKVIVFYNYDYELDILKKADYGAFVELAEWNGHKHQSIPTGHDWIYLVQYTAGAEGWNCITTDTVIFYSQNYSYKTMTQACGRIDRLSTPYTDLFYYHLKSRAGIDIAISKALLTKKTFNEQRFMTRL